MVGTDVLFVAGLFAAVAVGVAVLAYRSAGENAAPGDVDWAERLDVSEETLEGLNEDAAAREADRLAEDTDDEEVRDEDGDRDGGRA